MKREIYIFIMMQLFKNAFKKHSGKKIIGSILSLNHRRRI